MRRVISALLLSAFVSGCAQNTGTPNELYPHPPGSLGNPAAKATALTGVTVLLLTAVLIHTLRDQ